MAPVGCDCRGGCYGSRPLAGLNGSLSGPFVSPMNNRDNPGCRYHTEVIKIPRRDECTGQIAGDVSRLGEKKKKTQNNNQWHSHVIMISQCVVVGGGAQLKPSVGGVFSLL